MGEVQEVDCDLTKEQVAELKQAFDMFDRLVVLLKLVLRVANNQCPFILNSIFNPNSKGAQDILHHFVV